MKNLKPLLTYLVAFVVFALINRFLFAHPVIEVLAMAAMVLFAVQLLRFLLSLIKPKERKGLTLISLFSSLLHYVAALVILCWGLSILGVTSSCSLRTSTTWATSWRSTASAAR